MTHVLLPILRDLIAANGRGICEDARKLRALLSDLYPGHKRDVYLLTLAVEHRVVAELLNSSASLPWDALSGRLARRMVDELGITESAARWSLEVWGAALERFTPPLAIPAHRPTPPPESPADPERPRPARRPLWVIAVAVLYLLMLALPLLWPVLALAASTASDGLGPFIATLITSAVILLLGGSLVIIPVGNHWHIPRLKRSLVFPLFGSATCAALLFVGAGIAGQELLFGTESSPVGEAMTIVILIGTAIAWVIWVALFAYLSISLDSLSLSDRMYKWLIAGSLLELLVAVPAHIVVRRRGECCGGMATGLGIGIGVVIMFLALGPAVFFLFFRRYKQAYSRNRIRQR